MIGKSSTLRRTGFLLALTLVLIFLTSSITTSGEGTKVFHRGAVVIGNTAYYEVANAVHINISDYVNRPNQWSLVNFSTKYSTSRDVTVMFANITLYDLQRHAGFVLANRTVYNYTYTLSVNGTPIEQIAVNASNVTFLDDIWNDISLNTFNYEGFTVQGKTIKNLGTNLNGMYRIRGVCPPNEARCEYSIIFNATIASTQVFVDFDPVIDDTATSSRWDFDNDVTDSLDGKDWTQTNGGQHYNTTAKFGDTSGQFNTSNFYLRSTNMTTGFTNFSFSAWIRIFNGNANRVVFNQNNSAGLVDHGILYQINNPNTIAVGVNNGSGLKQASKALNPAVNSMSCCWTFTAFTANTTHVVLYVNDSAPVRTAFTGASAIGSEGRFGARGLGSNDLFFEGMIDRVRVKYDGLVWTPAEVSDLYNEVLSVNVEPEPLSIPKPEYPLSDYVVHLDVLNFSNFSINHTVEISCNGVRLKNVTENTTLDLNDCSTTLIDFSYNLSSSNGTHSSANSTISFKRAELITNVSVYSDQSGSSIVSTVFATEQLFGVANITSSGSAGGILEENSTFKWFINDTVDGVRTTDLVPLIYKDAVGYWHLDSDWNDSSGNNNFGNATTTSLAAGIVGKAVVISTAATLVNVSGVPFNFGTGNFSIAFWEKNAASNGACFVSKWDNLLTTSPGWDIGYLTGSGGQVRVQYNDNAGGTVSTLNGVVPEIDDGGWHYVAVTFNKQGSVIIYVDGSNKGSAGLSTVGNVNNNVSLNIGSCWRGGAKSGSISATMDEVAVYNRSLTASEVKQLYLRTWYDHSPQVFLLQPFKDNATSLNTSDHESPTAVVNSAASTNVSGRWSGTYGVNLSNGYINYSASGNFNEREGTVEFWVKPEWDGNDGLFHTFVTAEKVDNDLLLFKNNGNNLVSNVGGIFANSYSISSWLAGDWHHLALTWNNYTSSTTLHVDGVQVDSSGTSFAMSQQDYVAIGVENLSGTPIRWCNCTFSEFRISRKALTEQEINLSFSKGRAYLQNEYLLNSSNYAKGDSLLVEYTPKDSAGFTGASQNSSTLSVQNTLPTTPSIVFPTEGLSTNFNRINYTSTDADGDAITYYITINNSINGTATGNFTFTSTAEKTLMFNVSAYDGQAWSANSTTVQFFYDNLSPVVSGTNYLTTGKLSASPLLFGQTIDWIAATVTDGSLLQVNITVTGGDGTTQVDNQLMTNDYDDNWNYTTNILLDSAGNWTVDVAGIDNAGGSFTQSTNITVNTVNKSTTEGLYGYTDDKVFSVAEIVSLSDYKYELYEFSENITNIGTSWNTVLAGINQSKDASGVVGLNYILNINYSVPNDVDMVQDNVTAYFTVLKVSPYISTVQYVSFQIVNESGHNDSDKYTALNDIAQTATNAFTNQFAIYSKNYNNTNLSSSYIKYTPLLYVMSTSQSDLVIAENNLLRQNRSLNRVYVNLTSTLKSQAKSYQDDVINILRGTPSLQEDLGNDSIAAIDSSVNDVVVFNSEANEKVMNINISNVTGVSGKDVWDTTQKKLIDNNTNGAFNVNVSAYSASVLFTDDIDHIQLSSLVSGSVFKGGVNTIKSSNYSEGGRASNYALYGANDFRIELFDPHYVSNNFITYYGWINASTVNLSNAIPYSVGIIADENVDELAKINKTTEWYGYISVADYANTQAWEDGKKDEVDDWVALNESMNIFIDGLDTGIAGANFSTRLIALNDYARIDLDKKTILNTYTFYENFSTIGDGVMKESCINRWNGDDAGNPTSYSREEWSLEFNRSVFFKNHNIPVYCQSFVNRSARNLNQIDNYTDVLNIYFASAVLGYQNFYSAQPDFNQMNTIKLPDIGNDLANAPSTDDNTTYYRRFSNGIVYYNTSSTSGWFDDGRTVADTKLCFDLYDNHANGVTFQFTINREVTSAEVGDYNFSDSELDGVGVWTRKCVSLNETDRDLGRWDVQGFVMPRTTIVGQGLNIANDDVLTQDRHSWHDSSTDPNVWTQYGMGTNWVVDIEINETRKTSIDTINTITQTEANTSNLYNITLSSGFPVNTEVWSNPTTIAKTDFINLTYFDGTNYQLLYPNNVSNCDNSNPSWNTTLIGDNPFKSCIETNGSAYTIRVAPYKLSSWVFTAEFLGNTAPSDPTIIFPSDGETTNFNRINYSSSDAEGDSITYHIHFNGTENGTAVDANFTFVSSPEKTLAVNVSACDASLCSGNTSFQFFYDNLSPTIDFGLNTPANNTFTSTTSHVINFSWSDGGSNHTFVVVNGTTNTTEVNATVSGSFWINWTGLADANYTFYGYLNDTAGNDNQTGNRTVVVDTTAPTLDILLPVRGSVFSGVNITFNFSVGELYRDTCWFKVTDGNDNLVIDNRTTCGNTTFLIGTGNLDYVITLYTNDTAGNENSTTTTFSFEPSLSSPTGGISGATPPTASKIECKVSEQLHNIPGKGTVCVPCSGNIIIEGEEVICKLPNGEKVNVTDKIATRNVSVSQAALIVAGGTLLTALFGQRVIRARRRRKLMQPPRRGEMP